MNELKKIIRQTLNEFITQRELSSVEQYADNLFSDVGVDVEFTKHFFDRVNDIRNGEDITPEELKDLYLKAYKKYSEMIPDLKPGEERVFKDRSNNINIPFVMSWDGKSPELDMVSKTIMRKKDFKSHTPILQLEDTNENIDVPINVGDEVLGGKFKNKKIKVKDIGKNEKGDITINDKPLLRVRTLQEKESDDIIFLEKKPKFNTNYGVGSSTHKATWQDGWTYLYKYNAYNIKKDSNWIDDNKKFISVAKVKNNPDKIVSITISNFKNSDEPLRINKDIDDSELKKILKAHEEKLKNDIIYKATHTDSKELVNLVNKNTKGFTHIIKHLLDKNEAKNIGEAFVMTIADYYPEYRHLTDAILKIALNKGYVFTNYNDFKKLLYKK